MLFFVVVANLVVKLVVVVNLVVLAGDGGGCTSNFNYMNAIDKSERHTSVWLAFLVY